MVLVLGSFYGFNIFLHASVGGDAVMNEANLVSFKVFIDSSGVIKTEMAMVPFKELVGVFKDKEELLLVQRVIRLGEEKLGKVHEFMSDELSAIYSNHG